LPNIPNAIALAYHGGNDPFASFPGNNILGLHGLSGYPTGIVDRVSGIQSYNPWYPDMLDRLDIPPTVDIRIDGNYNDSLRLFSANIEFESMEAITGEFKYNIILVEDSIVWAQSGSSGGPNYVHDWTVRDMMNGAEGQLIYNGIWDPHQTFTDSISHTIALPVSPAPDIRPEHCRIVVLVYSAGSPLHSNAEIQQAIMVPLTKNAYDVELQSSVTDVLQNSNSDYSYDIQIENTGKSNEEFYLNLDFIGPAYWTCTYATPNGLFSVGSTDSIFLTSGEMQTVQVNVNPEMIEGFGRPILTVSSKNNTEVKDTIELRFVTSNVENLVIDDDNDKDYEDYTLVIFDSLQIDYGLLKSSILSSNVFSDFDNFNLITWQTGTTRPGLTTNEMNFISHYLDQGGNLYISGVDLAYQLADPSSAYYSQVGQEFLTNYLHATYIDRDPIYTVGQGVVGDTITNNITRMWLYGGTGANIIRGNSGKYANMIDTADTSATPIFSFYFVPNNVIGIRANHQNNSNIGNVFFTTFGFETIAEIQNRYEFLHKMTNYLQIVSSQEPINEKPGLYKFRLNNNYPNPFNATTNISFDIPEGTSTNTQVIIFDVLGKKIKSLLNNELTDGSHKIRWNGKNDFNTDVSSGIYYVQLIYGDMQQSKKILLLR